MSNGWSFSRVGLYEGGSCLLLFKVLRVYIVLSIFVAMLMILLFIPKHIVYEYSLSLFILIPSYHPYY